MRAAEDGWNGRDPEKVAAAYTGDSRWRTFGDDRIAVRFAYEWHDDTRSWFRSYGHENWELDAQGLRHRYASINDLPVEDSERRYHWDLDGPRPADHPGLSDLGL